MKKYFGIFEDLVNQHSSYVNEQEFYYEDTVEFYDLLSISYDDFSFFYRMANVYGGPILDLCCGSGRLLIPMAKKGFDVTGVDLSKDMLSQLDMLLNSRYRRIKNNVSLFQQDMAT